MSSFNRIRYRRHDATVFLYAFDLIEVNGDDLRRDPLEVRKATLASIVAKARPGIRFNEHIEGDARPSSPMTASSDWKALCQSARTQLIARDARPIGSK
jgi:ATP-dependent DNA ligase